MIAWYIVPYLIDTTRNLPRRYCAMDEYTASIYGDDGVWAETEIRGNHTIVSVRASAETIALIDSDVRFLRLPPVELSDRLDAVNPTALYNKLIALGYNIDARFGSDIRNFTLKAILDFATEPIPATSHYDAEKQEIVFRSDELMTPRPVADIETIVKAGTRQ
jgi:hypothetical protein